MVIRNHTSTVISMMFFLRTTGYIRVLRRDDDDSNCQMDKDPLVGLACAIDDNGNKLDVKPAKICGTVGILFDVSYPVGVSKIE